MPNIPNQYPYPCIIPPQMYNMYPYPFWCNQQMYYNMYPYYFKHTKQASKRSDILLKDYGPDPMVFNIEDVTRQNDTFSTTLWTGENFQVILMSIDINDDIGLEVHKEGDQFIRIEDGEALIQMGDTQYNLDFERKISNEYAVIIPAGKWHNIINIGNRPIKLYIIYAPPEYPKDTVHPTKADSEAAKYSGN